ncbi:hypothetical protein HMPREF1868_01907 [Olsenella sp. DNF00959]|nr:hypothetical protein HMPREF1868_01907 [Olsenella sp. DNF00959]
MAAHRREAMAVACFLRTKAHSSKKEEKYRQEEAGASCARAPLAWVRMDGNACGNGRGVAMPMGRAGDVHTGQRHGAAGSRHAG